jgi:hypothetical protein
VRTVQRAVAVPPVAAEHRGGERDGQHRARRHDAPVRTAAACHGRAFQDRLLVQAAEQLDRVLLDPGDPAHDRPAPGDLPGRRATGPLHQLERALFARGHETPP